MKKRKKKKKIQFTLFGDYRGWPAALHLLVSGARRLLRAKDSSDGDGTANTALVWHARRLLALHEGDLPYVLRVACDGVVETVGRLREFGAGGKKEKAKNVDSSKTTKTKTKLDHPFTAHPKVDPATGELFGIGYNVERKPYLYYFALDAEGKLKFDVPIDTPVSGDDDTFVYLVSVGRGRNEGERGKRARLEKGTEKKKQRADEKKLFDKKRKKPTS